MKLIESLTRRATRARNRRTMLELSDWQLKDIGLTRHDLMVMLTRR